MTLKDIKTGLGAMHVQLGKGLLNALGTAILMASVAVTPNALAGTIVRVSSFQYYPNGMLSVETVEPDNASLCLQTSYGYDAYGNKTSSTTKACTGASGDAISSAGDARTVTTAYEAQTVTIGGTQPLTFSVPAGTFPTKVTNAMGHTESRVFDPRSGQISQLIGPNGAALATTWKYDGFGRKIQETRADGTYTQWNYLLCTAAGNTCPTPSGWVTVEQSYAVGGAVNAPEKRAAFDTLNRLVRSQTQGFDGFGSSPILYQDTTFNALGQVQNKTGSYDSANPSNRSWNSYTYDALGRVLTVDSSDASERVTAITYHGLITTVVRAGQSTITTKNAQGQTASVTDANGKTISYGYDALGQLISTNAAGSITSLGYDTRGRKTSLIDPAMGSWLYYYNAFGELVRQIDSLNQPTYLSYDKLGRMIKRIEPDLTSDWSYETKFDHTTSCGPSIGKLCEARADNGYLRSHLYDSLGRPSSTATVLDNAAAPATVSLGYESGTGRLVSKTWPTGYQASYQYSALGYLTRVASVGSNGVSLDVLAMNPQGQITQYRQGNQVTTVRNISSSDNRLRGVTATMSGQSAGNVFSQTYDYDALGNLKYRNDSSPGVGTTENFSYDALNRLNLYAALGGAVSPPRSIEVQYDDRGNITYKSDVGRYWYDATRLNRLIKITPENAPTFTIANTGTRSLNYAFDDSKASAQNVNGTAFGNGNLMSVVSQDGVNGRNTMRWETYTSFNMPNQIMFGGFADLNNPVNTIADRTLTYVYGPEHQRIKETVQLSGNGTSAFTSGTTWYLNGEDNLGLTYEKLIKTNGTTEHKHYMSAGGLVFALYVSRMGNLNGAAASSTRYFHHDQLGSIAAISDENGQVVERLAYDPWGKRRFVNGNADVLDSIVGVNTERGYTMHEHLDEVGVIHMNGRIYDPLMGRFMSADPFIQNPSNLQSYNRYAYVLNNPLTLSDPSGYFSLSKALRTIAAIAVAVYVPQMMTDYFYTQGSFVLTSSGMSLTTGAAISTGLVGGFAAGLVASGGDIQSGLQGAFSGGLFGAAGTVGVPDSTGRYLAHAAAGCVSSVAGSGTCGSGAVSALFGKYTTNQIGESVKGDIAKGVAAAVAGGVGSVIAGGKFENGAVTATYAYLFNQMAQWRLAEQASVKDLVRAGYLVAEQVALTVTDAAGGTFSVIADSVAMKGDQLIITEVKDGMGARLSVGQKAMFEVAFGQGKIAISTAENAAKFGLEAGTSLFSQSAKLTQIAIRLEAAAGGRAAGQLIRLIGSEGVAGGVIRGVLGVGGALVTHTTGVQ